MNIVAVAEKPVFSIEAALQSRPARLASALLARADIRPTGRMTLAEVNAKLAVSPLSAEERIQAKISLERSGILQVD
jgi:hypothetical protein